MSTETPKPKRRRRPPDTIAALRLLARQAAEAGEPLCLIRRRLDIPKSTLKLWARQEGYRACDIAARAEAAEAAHTEADEIRQQADELWQMCEEMQERPTTGARRQVEIARARTLALAEAGLLDAAEEEIASVRRLARLLAFGRAGTGGMDRFVIRAALMAEDELFHAILTRPDTGPAPLPAEGTQAAPLALDDLLREEKESAARWDPWAALIAAKKQLAEMKAKAVEGGGDA